MYTRIWLLDTLERLAKTAVQVFLAQLIASGMTDIEAVTDTSNLQRAAIAGLGAGLSFVFSIVTAWAASSNGTASLIPEVVAAPSAARVYAQPDNH